MRTFLKSGSVARIGGFLKGAVVLLCGLLAGCTTVALRDSTVAAGATVTDLHYQMVLSNIAMFRADSGALPWHLKITQGTVEVTDAYQASLSIEWPPALRTGGLLGGRTWGAAWTVVPVVERDVLTHLREEYQKVANDNEFKLHFDEGSSAGGAPFGQYGGHFVWVRPKHLGTLTDLTMKIVGLAPIEGDQRPIRIPNMPLR